MLKVPLRHARNNKYEDYIVDEKAETRHQKSTFY
jgi:hypothetical protein